MTILVTGAAGFIGRHLVDRMLSENADMILTDIVASEDLPGHWKKRVPYQQADLNNCEQDWYAFFDRPESIIHLAWEGLPHYRELYHVERNMPNNYYFLKNLVSAGMQRATVIGTCLEYGLQVEGECCENMPSNPSTAYAVAKDTLRKNLECLQMETEFSLSWVRLFYLYGRGQSENSILSQLARAIDNNETVFNMSPGDQLRDYLPVEKVAELIYKIHVQDGVFGIINCCSGKPVTVKSLVENYLKESNQSITLNTGYYPYPEHEPKSFWGSTAKLKTITGEK